MSQHDILIDRILSASGIVGRERRSDVAREMRSHIEDIIEEERAAGHNDQEIARLVAIRFGQASQIADDFARVYRMQRIGFSLLSYSLLAIVSILAVAIFVYTIQYGSLRWFGVSTARIFSKSHMGWEAIMFAGLTFGYLGLYFVERVFEQKRFAKTLCLVGMIVAIIVACLGLSGFGGVIQLSSGFLFAVLVRTTERLFAQSALRLTGILAFFAAIALIEPFLVTYGGRSPAWFLFLPLYLAIAVSSQFVRCFASIFDRQILRRHLA
jgi:hypothetical protein